MSALNMNFDKKKYISMERVLQQINQECISLSDEEVKRNNGILKEVLTVITNKMKKIDLLFNLLFSTFFYGGSFFDGLKVGSPEEYDIDFLLELPKFSTPKVIISNIPGFLHIRLETFEKLVKQPEFERYKAENQQVVQARNFYFQNRNNQNYKKRKNPNNYKTKLHLTKTQKLIVRWLTETGSEDRQRLIPEIRALLKLVDNQHYLLTSKFSRWFEGLIQKALQSFPKVSNGYELNVNYGKLVASVHKGGPAFTLKIIGSDVKFDVDLVPSIIFRNSWPEGGYTRNTTSKKDFCVVPKQPRQPITTIERYWRTSFHEQERVIINNYRTLKPSIRLLKRLRDIQNHSCIASYYIKTISLWEITQGNEEIFQHSLSYAFMKMLHILQAKIDKKEILYFWNKKNNLINHVRESTLTGIANQLKNIINDINNHIDDPNIIMKYFRPLDYNMARLSLEP